MMQVGEKLCDSHTCTRPGCSPEAGCQGHVVRERAPADILAVLATKPRLNVWDLCELSWLAYACNDLKRAGLVVYDHTTDGFPWCRYVITDAGRAWLAAPPETPLQRPDAAA